MALNPTFKKMETLENCVKIDYLKNQLGWNMEQVSYELNFNHRRMIEWLNFRSTAINQLIRHDPIAVENLRRQLSKDYPLRVPKKEKKLKLNVDRVVKYLREGKTLPELAKIFHCKENTYRLWHNENLRLINQKMKQKQLADGTARSMP